MLGYPEMILIFCAVLLVFGPSKLPDIAKSLGAALKEFKRASSELDRRTWDLTNAVETVNEQKGLPMSVDPNVTDSLHIEAEVEPNTSLVRVAEALGVSHSNKKPEELRKELMEKIEGRKTEGG